MAFALQDDLAPELYPLSWLVGTWHGFGMLAYEGIPERSVVCEMTFDHDGGPYLRCSQTIWDTDRELSGPVEPEMSGAAGYEALVKDVIWSAETSYWRPVSSQPAEGGHIVQLEVVVADPAGHLSLFVGEARGPRISLSTDAVVSTPTAAPLAGATRMFGLVASDLLWAHDIAAFGQPLGSYSSGRLSRLEPLS